MTTPWRWGPKPPRLRPNWKNRCQCPCGCSRRVAATHRDCIRCTGGSHSLPQAIAAAVETAIGRRADREREVCTSCGRPFAWYELKPGDGRCRDCQT